MHPLDKIKTAIAFILLTTVIVLFVVMGKDHDYTRWAAGSSVIIWLLTMFFINRMKGKS